MFEVGFSELCMVALVALLVIGPERLPKVARLAGFWLGKARSTVNQVKSEIRAELHAEEMRQMLEQQQAEFNTIHQTLDEVKEVMQDAQASAAGLPAQVPGETKPAVSNEQE
ncbi:MAG: twin-arginine translocase subunit TatB [Methylobacter sp.]|nr:MAG: twin-arginine translocase subunit TatB [Methylobacter sp.]PPD24371.1 MAG: twin-arginine translocase subunit TatB [Methylobacter sp.]